jgi:hypothetical protein
MRRAIIRMGRPVSGHCISFARDKARWLRFDDTNVTIVGETEVFEVFQGKLLPDETTAHSWSYILVYEHPHAIACGIRHIQELNQEANEHQLVCSHGDFKLMGLFEDPKNHDHNDLVMRYTATSLMFSTLSKAIKQFFRVLSTKALITANEGLVESFRPLVPTFLVTCSAV